LSTVGPYLGTYLTFTLNFKFTVHTLGYFDTSEMVTIWVTFAALTTVKYHWMKVKMAYLVGE
jgi:hypothetical protein